MKILNFLTNNWKIKLMAIIAAAAFWLYAVSVRTSVATFPVSIPVVAVNLNPGYVAIFDKDSIKINISANNDTWNKLSSDSFAAFVDLNGYDVGTHKITVNVTTKVAGVSILSRDPGNINVTIEQSVSKNLPVSAQIVGDAAENMIAGSVLFDPENITVSGPRSVIDKVDQATARIVLSGENADFTSSVKVYARDQAGEEIKYLSFLPTNVLASVKIVSAGSVKNLGINVVTTGSPAAGYSITSITTDPPTLSVSGSSDALRQLNSISTVPVSISGASQNFTAVSNLVFPIGIRSNGVSSVLVTISISNQLLTKTLSVPIETVGLPSGLSIKSINPERVDITISGSESIIKNISSGSGMLILNLTTAATGSKSYQISSANFSLPTGVNLLNFSAQAATISIQ